LPWQSDLDCGACSELVIEIASSFEAFLAMTGEGITFLAMTTRGLLRIYTTGCKIVT